jgi:hypothetical protein
MAIIAAILDVHLRAYRFWNGISRSCPASAAFFASRMPQTKSVRMKPAKPYCSLRISVSRTLFCPHHSPLTLL